MVQHLGLQRFHDCSLDSVPDLGTELPHEVVAKNNQPNKQKKLLKSLYWLAFAALTNTSKYNILKQIPFLWLTVLGPAIWAGLRQVLLLVLVRLSSA